MEKIKTFYNSIFFDRFIRLNFDVFVIYIIINMYILVKVQSSLSQYNSRIDFSHSYKLIIANFFIISSIYLLNKVSDFSEDKENNTAVENKYSETIVKYYVFVNMLSFIIYFYVNKDFLKYWLIFFVLGLLYSYPKRFKLKKYLLLKNLLPAFSWYLSICILILLNTKIFNPNILDIFFDNIFILFTFFLFEILWDIPDRNGDKKEKIMTVPVMLGFQKTKFLIIASNIFLLTISKTSESKIAFLTIILFLFIANEDSNKKYYHLIILFISLIYIVYGLLLLLKM